MSDLAWRARLRLAETMQSLRVYGFCVPTSSEVELFWVHDRTFIFNSVHTSMKSALERVRLINAEHPGIIRYIEVTFPAGCHAVGVTPEGLLEMPLEYPNFPRERLSEIPTGWWVDVER